jgi:hypothetical protein
MMRSLIGVGEVLLLRENVKKLLRQNVKFEYSLFFILFKYFAFSIAKFSPRMINSLDKIMIMCII